MLSKQFSKIISFKDDAEKNEIEEITCMQKFKAYRILICKLMSSNLY